MKVRLSEEEQQILLSATHKCFGINAHLWVFGSRADLNKKGGNIDLYIETDQSENIMQAKLDFREAIYDTFGEQKIDIIVHNRSKPKQPIHEIALETGVELTRK